MALCVFLFCTLQSVLTHLDGFIEGRSPRRIVTRNAMSLIGVVPLAGSVAIGLGLCAGFVPAWGAYRARVTEMLRTT